MTIIVANNTPDAVRGILKRWFIEPKANVFVGTINSRIRDKVIAYIRRNSPYDLGLLIISSDNSTQGYSIKKIGQTNRRLVVESGLNLILEKWNTDES